MAITLTNLGDAYRYLGDAAKSRDLLERALAIDEREYGPDHREVAITLVSLGNAYGSLGNAAKSRDLLERALAILEREYGPDHRNVASTLGNLGNAYGSLGDAAKQRDLLERALAIQESEYGPDHRDVAITLTNLGNAYDSLGDAAKKRDLLERVLVIEAASNMLKSEKHPHGLVARLNGNHSCNGSCGRRKLQFAWCCSACEFYLCAGRCSDVDLQHEAHEHLLQIRYDGRGCDVCGAFCGAYSIGCRACDWDVCKGCMTSFAASHVVISIEVKKTLTLNLRH